MKPFRKMVALSALCTSLCAEVPTFFAPTLINDGTTPIHLEIGYAAPIVTDWNGDGKKDLIVGQFKSAKLRLYRNLGNDNNPQFEGFEYLKAGGEEISLTAG